MIGAVSASDELGESTMAATTVASREVTEPTFSPGTTDLTGADLAARTSCNGLCVDIVRAEVTDDGEMLVHWEAVNFEPSTTNIHAHFFYDIYRPEQVGTNNDQYSVQRGDWQLTDDSPLHTRGSSVAVAGAPAGARKLCVVAADSGHGVINPENADCVDLP